MRRGEHTAARGFDRASAYLYSAPQPFTKLILMVHILVSW